MKKFKIVVLFIILLLSSFILLQPKYKKILFVSNIKMKTNDHKRVSYHSEFELDFNGNTNENFNKDMLINENDDLNLEKLKSVFYDLSSDLFTSEENEFGKSVSQNIKTDSKGENNLKYSLFYNRQKIESLFIWDDIIVTDLLLVKVRDGLEVKHEVDEFNHRFRITSSIEIIKSCRYIYSLNSQKIDIYPASEFSSLILNEVKINYKDYNENSKAFLTENDAFSTGISKFEDDMNPFNFRVNYEHSYKAQKEVYGHRLFEITQDFSGLKLKDNNDYI